MEPNRRAKQLFYEIQRGPVKNLKRMSTRVVLTHHTFELDASDIRQMLSKATGESVPDGARVFVRVEPDNVDFDVNMVRIEWDTSPSDVLLWQCSGCLWGFSGPHLERCPACQRVGYWTGSVRPGAHQWPSLDTTENGSSPRSGDE